jgi:hypothetical protein
MSGVVTFVIHYGYRVFRTSNVGADLSEFQYQKLELTDIFIFSISISKIFSASLCWLLSNKAIFPCPKQRILFSWE